MPYEDFPPLEERKTRAPNAATLDQATGAAQWAETFGKGDTNLMLRKRHNQDIQRETELMQQSQAAYQQNELRTSKVSQDLYFRSGKLEMDKKLGAATLELREQKFNHDQEMFPEKLATERARTARIQSQEREAVKGAKLKEDLAAQQSMDSESFMDNLRASGAKPGSPEFMDELVKNRLNFPGSHGVYTDMFRAYSGSKADSEEVFETRKAALAAAGPNTTVTAKLPGGVTITDRPGTETKDLQAQLKHLQNLSTRSNVDPEQKAYFKKQIEKVEAQMSEPVPAASAPAPDVNKAALDWVTSNPTDPRAAAIKAKLGLK